MVEKQKQQATEAINKGFQAYQYNRGGSNNNLTNLSQK
jgi:hypothetical protein